MKKYVPVEHPSDTGITAFGKSMKEAYENAALGMMDIMFDISKAKPLDKIKLEIKGDDEGSLLVNWLNEILYFCDARKMLFSEFKISEFSDKMLRAVVSGERFDPARHKGKLYIKAATYNQLEISKDKDGYRVKVIFDV